MNMEADDSTNLRVASFSYYLDTAKESSLVRRVSAQDNNNNNITIKFSNTDSLPCLNDPVQDPTSAFSFSHSLPKLAAAEIGVFGADKYFNMKLEYQTAAARTRLAPPPATPSSCSDSTSWHSQSTLLPNFRQSPSQMKQKKAMASRIFMGIGCRVPCFDKKSIRIDELVPRRDFYSPNHPPSRTGSQQADADRHPPLPAAAIQDLEESRRSLEVFGSRNRPSKGDVATNMERKLSMLTWDAIPKGRINPPPTSAAGTSTLCDDVASEASSDLFEIENISGSVYTLAAAAADDAASSACMSPTSLYAPSEASIQWSVVTASAADYSALSEFNDDSVSVADRPPRGQKKEAPKISRPAGLLGCKNLKAVDVAQNVCVKSFNKD